MTRLRDGDPATTLSDHQDKPGTSGRDLTSWTAIWPPASEVIIEVEENQEDVGC